MLQPRSGRRFAVAISFVIVGILTMALLVHTQEAPSTSTDRQTETNQGTCTCPKGVALPATITAKLYLGSVRDDRLLGTVQLTSSGNCDTVEVPEGYILLVPDIPKMSCGLCGEQPCTAEVTATLSATSAKILHGDDKPVIDISSNAVNNVAVTVTWKCTRSNCSTVKCAEKTYRIKVKKDTGTCTCQGASYTITVRNESRADATAAAELRRVGFPIGKADSHEHSFAGRLDFRKGNTLKISISNVEAKCWCDEWFCTPTITKCVLKNATGIKIVTKEDADADFDLLGCYFQANGFNKSAEGPGDYYDYYDCQSRTVIRAQDINRK